MMALVTPTCSRGGRGGGVDVPTMSETANEEAPALDSPPSLACTRGAEQVDPQAHKDFLMGVKARWAQLCARDEELTEVIERAIAEREAVRAEMASVNDKLDALIDAPVSGGHDPTLWLPDEIMELIFLMVPCEMLWDVCEHVCQRWRQIAQESSLVKQRKEKERWAAYEAGVIKPRVLEGHTDTVTSLGVGRLDGKIYSGSMDTRIRVWSGEDGRHMQTLDGRVGHTVRVHALAVGLDGKIYSGLHDRTIQVWSGTDGVLLQILRGHTEAVRALAVGLDGKIYSGSSDKTIRLWSGVDGAHLQTLKGHTNTVIAIVVGLDRKIYSGSHDRTIRVWSGVDGALLQILIGHTEAVRALAVGLDGKIYSGSYDCTIRVWSHVDGMHLQTLEGHAQGVEALAVGLDGKIFSGSSDTTIRVWSGVDGTRLQTLDGHTDIVRAVAVRLDGKVYSGSYDNTIRVW